MALLLFGPQDRGHNFGLNLFWCYWWPLSFLAYPFLGRIWCAGAEETGPFRAKMGLRAVAHAVLSSRACAQCAPS